MIKKTNDRNSKVTNILDTLYIQAKDVSLKIDETPYKDNLDLLFSTAVWGFREILLVVIIGMKLDPTYRSSVELYACKPRAIYEGPIKDFLIQHNIPHRKSGPLNIAKATIGLNESWAAQRKPMGIANAVLKIIHYIENDDSPKRTTDVGTSLMRRFIAETIRVERLNFSISPSSDPEFLYNLCYELITKVPDSGNTPQKIAALLLLNFHNGMNTGIIVTGSEDRASVTSTTSKKPGDVNEESITGTIYKVYEITVKKFDLARIRDSYDAVTKYNEVNATNLNEIVVICRVQDCPPEMKKSKLKSYFGSLTHNEMIYYYWDIFEWVSDTLQRMTEVSRQSFYSDLNNYIRETNTAEAVKYYWRELHCNNI